MLSVIEVEQQLIQIAREAHDDQEAATSRERRLLRDVLHEISVHGDAKSSRLAATALRSWELRFNRGFGA